MFPQSLRWRIEIWHGLLLAAVLTGFSFAAYRYQAANEMRRVDGELRMRVRLLLDALPPPRGAGEKPPPPESQRPFKLPAARTALFEGAGGPAYYYSAWRRDGLPWVRSSSAPTDLTMPAKPNETQGHQERTRGGLREAFVFTPPGECFLVGRSLAPENAALREYARWLAAISAIVLALGVAGGWLLSSRALRPIGMISTSARRIARGELSERIPVPEPNSELGRLASVLNDTFAQLEDAFARQSRFTADAAHELRTPVAIILSQAQRILTRERDPATYRQTLETCVKAARRLQQLTESLLTLATRDAGATPLNLLPCDLSSIARDTAELVHPLVVDRGVSLTLDLAPAPCEADPDAIAQIALNLITNALQHTPREARVTVRTGAENGSSTLTVLDTGPGIPADRLPHVFDRFYRADDSRSRDTGGAGLGLAICKSIAEAHGGYIEAASKHGHGASFTLKLPRKSPG